VSRFLDDLTTAAAARQSRGLTRRLVTRPPDARGSGTVTGGGLLDLAGNDYLGLSRHPAVVEAAAQAARDYGTGATASRLVTGTVALHDQLETALADLMCSPSALVFSTGYQANLGVLTALADADTLIVSDAHAHASLIDGCRLSRAQVAVTAHNDVAEVDRLLRGTGAAKAMVVVESVYSVMGDCAPLADLAEVTQRHDAVLLVDEAHALGVAGTGGRGLCAGLGIAALPEVVLSVTLSKSLAAQGGAVLAHPAVREHLVNTARPFIYDTGLAPPAAGAALAALQLLADDPGLPARARHNAACLAQACGVDVPAAAVLSVPMAGPREALDAVQAAARSGIRIGCFRPPSTPDGSSRLRLTAHAHHSAEQMGAASAVLRGITGGRGGTGERAGTGG